MACSLTAPALPVTSAASAPIRAPAALSEVDPDGAVGVGFDERPMHRGVHQDRLPGNAGGGRHRRRARLDREVGGLMRPDRRCPKPMRSAVPRVISTWVPSASLGPLTDAWIEMAPRSGRWAALAIRPLAGSSALHRRLDRVPRHTAIDRVVARTVQALKVELDRPLGQRWQVSRSVQRQRGGDAGDRRADDGLVDRAGGEDRPSPAG